MVNQIILALIVGIGITFIQNRGRAHHFVDRKIPVPIRSEVSRTIRRRIRR